MRGLIMTGAVALLCGCATTAPVSPLHTADIVARGETAPVGTANDDAADDPAIWRNPADPAASLVVGTDKKAGLYVYGMDGQVRDYRPDGLLNNVDLVDMGDDGILVAASDRTDPANAAITLYRMSHEGKLSPLGSVPGGVGEAYGFCLLPSTDGLRAFSVLKHGTVREYRIDLDGPTATPLRTMMLGSQAEGCVADPRDGTLYVGEEDVGIWRFAAGESEGTLVAAIDNAELIADVEGLAILPQGDNGGWLVASSQGDSAYAVYTLPGMEYAGRFRIAAGEFGAAEETDGIGLMGGSFGPDFPDGLFVAQDGVNPDSAQNFKFVRWDEIAAGLGL